MIDRRSLLAAAASFAVAPRSQAQTPFAPKPDAWRRFEIVTRVELEGAGAAQAWIPAPSVTEADWISAGETTWTISGGEASLARDPAHGAAIVHARFTGAPGPRVVEVTSRFASRDRAVDLAASRAATLPDAARKLYTSATALIPLGGIVKQKSDEITRGATNDIAKARAIYEWIVDNSFRDPKTRGCGTGDVAGMLESGNLGGKCADLNALFVGLARAQGMPARDLYGLRVAASKFGYRSLGANSPDVTKAQHCRAEVWLEGIGWTPVDPADVRKVVLEEPPGNLAIDDHKTKAARATLFGAWEGNWLAYNTGHDVALPGSKGAPVDFLMYPQAEIDGERLDSLDPDAFRYKIGAREIEG